MKRNGRMLPGSPAKPNLRSKAEIEKEFGQAVLAYGDVKLNVARLEARGNAILEHISKLEQEVAQLPKELTTPPAQLTEGVAK